MLQLRRHFQLAATAIEWSRGLARIGILSFDTRTSSRRDDFQISPGFLHLLADVRTAEPGVVWS
jgi:hypothetical protein